MVNSHWACPHCQQSKIKCSRSLDNWKWGRRHLTEEEELVWRIFGRLPSMSAERHGRSGTTHPCSKSHEQSKSVAEGKSKMSRSKATKAKQVKTKGRKSKKVEESEEEDEEDEDEEDSQPVKHSRHYAGPSRPPTIWITGGHQIHDGPNPPNTVIRRLQLQQEKMET
jgi:hypothetical protein